MFDEAHQLWWYHLVGKIDAQSVGMNLRKLWFLSACKTSTSSLTSFLIYFKDIENLLFWKLCGNARPLPSKSLYQFIASFHAYLHAKIDFITQFFLKILQRNSKVVILGNLGMPGPTQLKRSYQFEETFEVYLQAKNQLYLSHFSWDIAKIL